MFVDDVAEIEAYQTALAEGGVPLGSPLYDAMRHRHTVRVEAETCGLCGCIDPVCVTLPDYLSDLDASMVHGVCLADLILTSGLRA